MPFNVNIERQSTPLGWCIGGFHESVFLGHAVKRQALRAATQNGPTAFKVAANPWLDRPARSHQIPQQNWVVDVGRARSVRYGWVIQDIPLSLTTAERCRSHSPTKTGIITSAQLGPPSNIPSKMGESGEVGRALHEASCAHSSAIQFVGPASWARPEPTPRRKIVNRDETGRNSKIFSDS